VGGTMNLENVVSEETFLGMAGVAMILGSVGAWLFL
jgi:hypothetical protein